MMAQMHRRFLLVVWAWFSIEARGAGPSHFETAHPFRSVSKWLIRSGVVSGDASEESVKRALLLLSKTQLMTKGVDGAAYKISARTGGSAARSNVTAELEKLHGVFGSEGSAEGAEEVASESQGPAADEAAGRPSVAAAKLVHKAMTAQHALRAAELIELAADAFKSQRGADKPGAQWEAAAAAALASLVAPPVCVAIDCEASALLGQADGEAGKDRGASAPELWCMVLREEFDSEAGVTVVLVDSLTGGGLLSALAAPPALVSGQRLGGSSGRAAKAGAAAAGAGFGAGVGADGAPADEPVVPAGPQGPTRGDSAEGACLAPVARSVLQAARDVRSAIAPVLERAMAERAARDEEEETGDGGSRPLAVRCVGHSFAGSVAALLSGLLSGAIRDDCEPPGGKREAGQEEAAARFAASCVCLGPCPCVGAALQLPGVTSVVLGDDLVARVQPQSLERLSGRLAKLTGGVAGVGGVATMGGAWLGDAFGSAARNLRSRGHLDSRKHVKDKGKKRGGGARGKGSQGRGAAAGESDGSACASGGGDEAPGGGDQLLACPGVVYLLKPRAGGEVAVVTTKRGGLGEALLWQMHDLLLSQSMLAHHLLEAYIEALDQV